MLTYLKTLFTSNSTPSSKRSSRRYQQRVRARERELRRRQNGEDAEARKVYFKPYFSAGVTARGV